MNRIYIYLLLLVALSHSTTLSSSNLTFRDADSLARVYYSEAVDNYANLLESNWQSGLLRCGEYKMPFVYYVNGAIPDAGYPLYISMHGGGGAPAEVNDEQWESQKGLYGSVDGVYLVPRAPTDTWNMWHQEYMDDLLMQIVTYSVARLNVDPSRVYLLGYSAGGDGVYNLASRLSDRFAAAAMMAGHPGDAQIEDLRNLPFAIYMGADDTAFNRSELAVEWLRSFERLHAEDQGGYAYNINIYANKGHWMDGEDGVAISWLAGYRRVGNPNRVVWIQDDVLHSRKYNLEVSNPRQGDRVEQVVDRENNTIYITTEHYKSVTIWLDDYIVDLDKRVVIVFNGREAFSGVVPRVEQNIKDSIAGRYDPEYIYWGRVTVGSSDTL